MKKRLIVILSVSSILIIGSLLFLAYEQGRDRGMSEARAVAVADTATTQVYPLATPTELLDAVNKERAKVGVAPLAIEDKLNKSAQWKADDMAELHYFAHADINKSTKANGLDYLSTLRAPCVYISENIHWNMNSENTSVSTIKGWMNSKPHHDAMLSSKYSLTGFGIAQDGTKMLVVEHFCQQP